MDQSLQLELFADYFQFYLQDDRIAEGNLADAWTSEAAERLLAVAPFIVGIGTVRNMTVPVRIEVQDSEPTRATVDCDHITECSLDVPTGRIVVAGCADYFPDAKRIQVQPGTYRVRVYYSNLQSLSEDGLDGDDCYRVVLWPGTPILPRVLKSRARQDHG